MLRTVAQESRKLILVAIATILVLPPQAKATPIDLGTAGTFAVLAGSAVASTGLTTITGDLGVSPGTAITGFPPGTVVAPFATHAGDGVAFQAQNDLTTAYNVAAGMAVTTSLTGTDLGGLTLTPGVYFFGSSAQLTGALTLDDLGDPSAEFVFRIGSTLTTAAGSSVVTTNGGTAPGSTVFWQVGTSATLGSGTAFEGHILALASITLGNGATILDGSALARNGAVTLDSNTITNSIDSASSPGPVPEPASMALVLTGALLGLRRTWGGSRSRRSR